MKKVLIILSLLLTTNSFVIGDTNKSCFRTQDINNWKALDTKRLIVWSPSRKHPYLVTLMNRCPGLTFEDRLIFKSTLSRICSNSQDTIYTEDMVCHIRDIQELDEIAVKSFIDEIEENNS